MHKCAVVHKCAVAEILEVFFYAVVHFRGQFHERFTSHVRKTKFSIIDISVIVGPSSILSLICDHVFFCVQTKIKANLDAGSLFFGAKILEIFFYEPKKCAVVCAVEHKCAVAVEHVTPIFVSKLDKKLNDVIPDPRFSRIPDSLESQIL